MRLLELRNDVFNAADDYLRHYHGVSITSGYADTIYHDIDGYCHSIWQWDRDSFILCVRLYRNHPDDVHFVYHGDHDSRYRHPNNLFHGFNDYQLCRNSDGYLGYKQHDGIYISVLSCISK